MSSSYHPRYHRDFDRPRGSMLEGPRGEQHRDYPANGFYGQGQHFEKNPRKLYIGNLPPDTTDEEIKREFRKFGRIVFVESKGKFAFVEFEHGADAEEAIVQMNDARFLGERIQVQPHNPALRTSRGPPSHQVVPPPPRNLGPRPTGRDRQTDYKVLVFNLDHRVSWQDLKDFGRNAGDVNFANVFTREGAKIGVIEYFDLRTMERALDRLHRMRLYDRRVYIEEDRGQLDGGGEYQPHVNGDGMGPRSSYPAGNNYQSVDEHEEYSAIRRHSRSSVDRSRQYSRSRSRSPRDDPLRRRMHYNDQRHVAHESCGSSNGYRVDDHSRGHDVTRYDGQSTRSDAVMPPLAAAAGDVRGGVGGLESKYYNDPRRTECLSDSRRRLPSPQTGGSGGYDTERSLVANRERGEHFTGGTRYNKVSSQGGL